MSKYLYYTAYIVYMKDRISTIIKEEIESLLLNEERGVMLNDIENLGFKLFEEFMDWYYGDEFFEQSEEIDGNNFGYMSDYKIYGVPVYVGVTDMLNSQTVAAFQYSEDRGCFAIFIDYYYSGEPKDLQRKFIHEFVHSIQHILSHDNYGKFSSTQSSDNECLYLFSYVEMQARLNQIIATSEKSRDKNIYNPDNFVREMKLWLAEMKSVPDDEIFNLMTSLSKVAKNNIRQLSNTNVDNEYKYLNNVTKNNYMKKYNIFIHDLEKRYKWFVSRLYYWANKLTTDMTGIVDRNLDRINKYWVDDTSNDDDVVTIKIPNW